MPQLKLAASVLLDIFTLALLSSFKIKFGEDGIIFQQFNLCTHQHIIQPLRLFVEGRRQHKHVATSSCVDTHYFCLVLFCTGLHLYKAALLLDLLAAILEGALESRVMKLTKSQDNRVVSACSDNHTLPVSAFKYTQSKF